MKKSPFSEDQIVRILREDEAATLPKAEKCHGASEQTIYAWRKRYGELDVADVAALFFERSRIDPTDSAYFSMYRFATSSSQASEAGENSRSGRWSHCIASVAGSVRYTGSSTVTS